MEKWRYYSQSWIGVSHIQKNQPCQDAVNIVETNQLIVAILADGLGSLGNSDVASETLVNDLPSFFEELHFDYSSDEKELMRLILKESQILLTQEAKKRSIALDSMNCTLLFVCIDKTTQIALVGQVGDGAICILHENNAELFYRPEKHVANSTATVLNNCESDCTLQVIDLKKNNIIGFILTSDGLRGEIYSEIGCVRKNAQFYFNVLIEDSAIAHKKIEKRKQYITSDNIQLMDDISLCVMSCAQTEISLPEDVTWLCHCGHRNDLSSTRCELCNCDIVKLHPTGLYKKHGGKLGTLQWLSQNPEEELLLIKPIDKISSDSDTYRGKMESDYINNDTMDTNSNNLGKNNKRTENSSRKSSSHFKPVVSSWSFTIKQVLVMMGITFLFSSILVSALWYAFLFKKQDDTTNESSDFNISSRPIYEDIYSFPIYDNEGFDGAYSGQTTYYKNKYMLPNGFGAYYLNGKIVVGKSNLGKKDGTFVSIDEDCSISFLTYRNGILVNRSGSFSYSNEDNETSSNTESNVESTAEQSTDYWYQWNTP